MWPEKALSHTVISFLYTHMSCNMIRRSEWLRSPVFNGSSSVATTSSTALKEHKPFDLAGLFWSCISISQSSSHHTSKCTACRSSWLWLRDLCASGAQTPEATVQLQRLQACSRMILVWTHTGMWVPDHFSVWVQGSGLFFTSLLSHLPFSRGQSCFHWPSWCQ